MNKALQIVLLAISIIAIKSEFSECPTIVNFTNVKNSDKDDYCRIYTTTTDKTHCCYFRYTNGSNRYETCRQISDDAYENIKRYKDFLKNTYSDVKIKCSSEFLTYSLFALLALLL